MLHSSLPSILLASRTFSEVVFSTACLFVFLDDHIVVAECQAPPNLKIAPPNLKINASTNSKEIILSWDHPVIMNGPLEKFWFVINEQIIAAHNLTERKYQRTYNSTVSCLSFIAQILIFAIRFQLKKEMSTELAYGE
jgi:hypothetical protein